MVYVAIMGFGTVGSGVAEVLDKNAALISENAAEDIRVKYILDVRDFPESPYRALIIRDFGLIEKDPEVKIVVETIGGVGVAYEFTRRALAAGKHVITSNKELVATHGAELLALAKANGVNYMLEAAVGGGIPVIRPMAQCLAANRIVEICGILNGTTNYILTQMIKNGVSFEAALADAQAKGYAEQNPTADVDGHDACRKICILSSLASGHHVYPDRISTEGISKVALADAAYARESGFAVKLLGRMILGEDGKMTIFVAPHFVPAESPLACVEDVFNGIMITGNAVDKVMFYGRGAGKLPTASAVIADIIDAAKHLSVRKYLDWTDSEEGALASLDDFESCRYLRFEGAPAKLTENVRVLSRADQPESEGALITGPMNEAAYAEFKCALGNVRICSELRVL